MSVPTTLQGTHDGCGGKVTFRPATHRRELLAGQSVVLSAACTTCGATLETRWQLPVAVIDAHRARTARPAEEAMPMAAGAEGWSQPAVADARGHAAPAAEAAPVERPVASLGDWRLRARPEQPAAGGSRDDAGPADEPSRHVDPAMQAYLDRFSSRVEHAREHLRRASSGLPAAFDEGGGGFRTPNLERRPSLAPTRLSATPAALRPAASAAPLAAPAAEIPSGAAVASAVDHAIASPSFHDDDAMPLLAPRAVASDPVAVPPQPLDVAAESATVAPEPAAVAPEAGASVAEQTDSAPVSPAPVVEPAAPPVAAVAVAAPAAPAAPIDLAPTDVDVFPAEPAAPLGAPPTPATGTAPLGPPPAPATGPAPDAPAPAMPVLAAMAQPASDAVANVWENLPVSAAVASAAPAAAATPAPVAAPAADAAAMHAAPTFGAAFDDAVDAGPPAGSPVAAGAPAMPEPAGHAAAIEAEPLQPAPAPAAAAMDVDASVAFEADRGFDWGPDADSPALPRRRRLARRRERPQADPAAGPQVLFEPMADPDLAEARPRVRVGFIHLALVLMLAVVCGVAAFKVFSTEPATTEPVGTVEPAVVVPPADGAAGAAADGAAAGGAAAGGAAAPGAGAGGRPRPATPAAGGGGARAGAAPATSPRTPGTPVADAGGAGTAKAASPAKGADAQVPAADADTPLVTASEAAAPDSNPFARP